MLRTQLRSLHITVLFITFAALAAGCCGSRAVRTGASPVSAAGLPPRPALINHAVFFKLKNPDDADELLADCDRLLATIPGVVSYYAGRHHEVGRGHVFNDYHVGMFVGFDSDEDYAVYADHPNHIAAVEKWRPRWEWIRVYDVLDESR
jgi:hypothetical protein